MTLFSTTEFVIELDESMGAAIDAHFDALEDMERDIAECADGWHGFASLLEEVEQ